MVKKHPVASCALRVLILAVLTGSTSLGRAEQKPKTKASPTPKDAVATVGDRVITGSQLEELAKERLARLRSDEYAIKRQILDDYITGVLLEKEAAARKITVEALQKNEIDDKMLAVTDEQKRAVYEANPQQFQGRTEAQAFAQIEANLKRVRFAEARKKLLAELRAKTPVTVLLEPPRVEVSIADAPVTGSTEAPVTIVEFSDFQCPACGQAYPVVKRLRRDYPEKVRLVHRHFPLPMHPLAPKAAEAAACAREQGKFWEMYDRLFTNQQALQVADLRRHATTLGLDAERFAACLDSGTQVRQWRRDYEEGQRLGISATPTFFINGRMLTGAHRYELFAQVVEDELARAGGKAQ